MQGKVFIDQITGDMYTYDQADKLFVYIGDIDQDTAADVQQVWKIKIKMVKSYHSKLDILNSQLFTYVIYDTYGFSGNSGLLLLYSWVLSSVI